MSEQQPPYNADAEQRVPFEVTHRGRRYTVAHIFGPLTDELLAEYDRRCDVRFGLADKKEAEGGRAVARSVQDFSAAVWLWGKLIESVEGYGPLEGEWQSKIGDKYKAAAIDSAVLNCTIDEGVDLPAAAEGEFLPLDSEDVRMIRLRAFFAGREVITEHFMREPSAEAMARFHSLNSRSLVVKGRRLGGTETRIPAKTRALGKLYDELCESNKGYAERVPLHHKASVVLYHLSAEQEVLEGN